MRLPPIETKPGPVLGRIIDVAVANKKVTDADFTTVSEAEAAAVHEELIGDWVIEDWKHPDYLECEAFRKEVLETIRKDRSLITPLRVHYKANPDDFINDWGYTFDPRNVEIGLPAKVPFILFQRQRDWIRFIIRKWQERRPGLTEKSRECGVSWLSIALGCTLCLHYTGLNIGYGSRKAEYVDKKGAPKSLFYKARKFMQFIPPEFNGGWHERRDAPLFRLTFQATESTMTGEGGDNIGRGDRASIYFVDEAAYLEQPESVEAALSQTTNCQQDISSVHGSANPFAIKRHSGKVEVFIFDWTEDPRKDGAWYQKQVDELDEVVVAQEIDRNYSASVEGIVIPNAWVRSAIDAHLKLGVQPTGKREGALDVADEGKDKCAFAGRHGILINRLEQWTGKGGDIFQTTKRAMGIAEDEAHPIMRYDSDGLGAGVRGDANEINKERATRNLVPIHVHPFRGSAAVWNPDAPVPGKKGRVNKDYYYNAKAQGWFTLRERFKATHRAVVEKLPFDPEDIISISSACPLHLDLVTELSQPTFEENKNGKLEINKKPEGARSPNLADAVMMLFAPLSAPLNITPEALAKSMIRGPGARRRSR